jgi:hypothetical protein
MGYQLLSSLDGTSPYRDLYHEDGIWEMWGSIYIVLCIPSLKQHQPLALRLSHLLGFAFTSSVDS